MLILAVNESFPSFSRVTSQDVGEARIKFDLILVQILVQLLRSQNLGDTNQLKNKEKFILSLVEMIRTNIQVIPK